jgi:predicted Zn-dependent protease with MMP-like domain
MVDVSRDQFERLVEQALDDVPAELAELVRNVAVVVEDSAPADDPGLLGLYEGTPLTERDSWYGGVLPDTITIFRLPLLAMCADAEEVRREVAVTVVHEIAHHFGIDDARLHELGYG